VANNISLSTYGDKVFFEDDAEFGDNLSRVRSQGSSDLYFVHPTDLLSITGRAGQKVDFNILEGFSGSIDVGSPSDSSVNPDVLNIGAMESGWRVSLSANKSIGESGSDADADIYALFLFLTARTGIGVGDALEVSTGVLEAVTDTGGIQIVNMGAVQIGGPSGSSAFNGLQVRDKGDVQLTAYGEFRLDDTNGEYIVAAGVDGGDVVIRALGGAGNIRSSVDQDAVSAESGNVVLEAGNNIYLGMGQDFDNDVDAGGSITVTAGGEVWVDGFTDLAAGLKGKGDMVVQAGRGIIVGSSSSSDASIAARGQKGGDVVLRTGAGTGLVVTTESADAVSSMAGNVVIETDDLDLSSISGISALAGRVMIDTATAGRQIVLGSLSSAGLVISQSELARIFSPDIFIGSATAGRVVVNWAGGLDAENLSVQSGSSITIAAGSILSSSGDLTVKAAGDVLVGTDGGLYATRAHVYIDYGDVDAGIGHVARLDAYNVGPVWITGNADSDTIYGGDFEDTIEGGAGADVVAGGYGSDLYIVSGADRVSEQEDEGLDTVQTAGNYALGANLEGLVLTGASDARGVGNGLDNWLQGNSGDNRLSGAAGMDTLLGGGGNDLLEGGKQKDRLDGGDKADTLNGGESNDVLTGGVGADSFLFDTALAKNVDKITDFNVAQDTILLDNAVFQALGGTGNLAGANFVVGPAAADGNDFIIYDSASGVLFYDADGNGAGAAIAFAVLDAGLALTRFDFVVV
jgi:Ca2+-binding RTX toxin-like protein